MRQTRLVKYPGWVGPLDDLALFLLSYSLLKEEGKNTNDQAQQEAVRKEAEQDEPNESKAAQKTDQTGPACDPGREKVLTLIVRQ